ncbi:peptidyl-tRNA hydrolase PTH2-domain-containing protein [Mycena amicta]|nr:peptidyl-tRNA hydrolase PTH2-domain-containing protein [Mycena amicta]
MQLTAPHIVALAILAGTSLALGYYAGRPKSAPFHAILDESEPDDQDLAAITAGLLEPCKLVLIVRTDLKMSPATIFARCGTATLACYRALVNKNPQLVRHWERTGQAKIALKATSEKQLMELEADAKRRNLCARVVKDGEVRTVLAIGPAPVEMVNVVSGKLRLL